jgi:stage V sporulation protein B
MIAGIVYAFALLCLKAISRDDVLMLPKGKQIVKILERHNWIK